MDRCHTVMGCWRTIHDVTDRIEKILDRLQAPA
jgi:hypothetical protein